MEKLINADEISEKLYYMVGNLKKGYTCHFTVVPLHNQFKIVGIFKHMPNMSTFTIDIVLEFARKTVNEDLPRCAPYNERKLLQVHQELSTNTVHHLSSLHHRAHSILQPRQT